MPIRFITGKPGGGKGLTLMDLLIRELVETERCIVTNFAIELQPWVTADGRPQLGLLAYLRKRYKKTFNAENRVFRLTDEQAEKFFVYRPVTGADGKIVLEEAKANVRPTKDGDERIMDFDTSLMSKSGGVLYAIDEAWKFWGSRNWQRTGEGVIFYNSQHRKPGDDVWIATQHTKQIDTSILRVSQEFWVVRNRGLLRVGAFRQPDDFTIAIYEDAPNGSTAMEPMSRKKFKLDINGVAQCYDTTGGVGLTGRMVGDFGKKKQGRSFKALIGALCLVPIITWFGINGLLKASAKVVVPKSAQTSNGQPNNTSKKIVDEFFPVRPPAWSTNHQSVTVKEKPVTMAGYYRLNGDWCVFLSDGRELRSSLGEIARLERNGVYVGTNFYRLGSLRSVDDSEKESGRAVQTVVSSPLPYQVEAYADVPSTLRVRVSPIVVWDAERGRPR